MVIQEQLKDRPNFLDWAKVIGMFSVILGHYVYYYDIPFSQQSVDWTIAHFVTLYHMPLFFIISGILYHRKGSIKDSIKKDFNSLIIPYLLICFIDGVIYYALFEGFHLMEIIKYCLGIAFGGDFFYKVHLFPAGPLWFLYSLFIVRCIIHIIGGGKIAHLLILFIALCIMFLNRNFLPLRLDSSMVGLLFFCLGVRFKDIWLKIGDIGVVQCCFFFVVGFVLLLLINQFYLNPDIKQGLSINVNYYGDFPPVFILSGCVGTFMVMTISKTLSLLRFKAVYMYSVGMIVPLGFHKQIMLAMNNLFFCGIWEASLVCFVITYFLTWIIIKKCPILIGNRIL